MAFRADEFSTGDAIRIKHKGEDELGVYLGVDKGELVVAELCCMGRYEAGAVGLNLKKYPMNEVKVTLIGCAPLDRFGSEQFYEYTKRLEESLSEGGGP